MNKFIAGDTELRLAFSEAAQELLMRSNAAVSRRFGVDWFCAIQAQNRAMEKRSA